MSETRFNLRRRIVLAAVLIPVALVACNLVERWWAERLRVYPEAYAAARALAEKEFGEAAVANGTMVVPGEPVSVPWSGTAVVTDPRAQGDRNALDWRRTEGCLVLEPRGGWLILVEHMPKGVSVSRVVRLTREEGAALWARLAYATRVQLPGEGVEANLSLGHGDIRLDGGARGRRGAKDGEDVEALGEMTVGGQRQHRRDVREIVVAGALDAFVAPLAPRATTDHAAVERAMRTALEQAFPRAQ